MTGTQPTDRFGAFGGRYVPETLIPALDELEAEYGKRLLWIEDAIAAIAEGEAPETFRAKLFPKKK